MILFDRIKAKLKGKSVKQTKIEEIQKHLTKAHDILNSLDYDTQYLCDNFHEHRTSLRYCLLKGRKASGDILQFLKKQ